MYLSYLILLLTLFFVVIFTLKGVFSNAAVLKSTLKSVGAFVILALICYFMAEGVETPLKDGGSLSEGGSKLVGAGLYLFYLLILLAGGIMLLSGIKKMIK